MRQRSSWPPWWRTRWVRRRPRAAASGRVTTSGWAQGTLISAPAPPLALLQEAHQRQQLTLLALSDELRATRARAADAERQLAAVRQRAAAARQALAQRQAALGEARQHLAGLARETGTGAASAAAFDQRALACQRADAALREQRMRCVALLGCSVGAPVARDCTKPTGMTA